MRFFIAFLAIVALALAIAPPTDAGAGRKLHVVTTLPDYACLAGLIGGDRIEVQAIVGGDQDAHFIRPKPSFVTLVAGADVLVDTGLDLEMWLPTVIDKSGNTRIRSGQPGYVATSQGMHLLEKPQTVSRIEGGVHLFGNPHVTCSPLLMKVAAENIAAGLSKNDPEGRETFAANLEKLKAEIDRRLFGEELLGLLGSKALTKLGTNGELVAFVRKNTYRGKPLTEYAGGWLGKMLPLAGKPVVTFHTNWVYFFSLFGLEATGTIEPKPGIPPSPKHVAELLETMKARDVRLILAANYFDEDKVRSIAESVGAAPVIVPLYVGGAPGAGDYFRLVDIWVDSLVRAARERGVIGDGK